MDREQRRLAIRGTRWWLATVAMAFVFLAYAAAGSFESMFLFDFNWTAVAIRGNIIAIAAMFAPTALITLIRIEHGRDSERPVSLVFLMIFLTFAGAGLFAEVNSGQLTEAVLASWVYGGLVFVGGWLVAYHGESVRIRDV